MNNEEKKRQYQKIICPYCFNKMLNPETAGAPFSDEEVEFRSESYYFNETDLLEKAKAEFADTLGEDIDAISNPEDIDLLATSNPSYKELSKWYEDRKNFIVTKDKKYQAFWDLFDSIPTEKSEKIGGKIDQWNLPIISKKNGGVRKLIKDNDGFVCGAIDSLGKKTYRRVCPHCHNPLPKGYGKNPVKNISVIGTTHCGKTVYISQLLKGMEDYLAKVGLSAFQAADQASEFIKNNKIERGLPFPPATSEHSFSQPVFYDVVRANDDGLIYTDTLVIYDIAGENCEEVDKLMNFTTFISESQGLILLVEPEQIGLIPDVGDNIENIGKVLTTLHQIIPRQAGEKIKIPVAFCISKSDKCSALPNIANQDVRPVISEIDNLAMKKFNGMDYNVLEKGLSKIIINRANSICIKLRDNYLNFNFFAVSATGCGSVKMEDGSDRETPEKTPHPKRIEEPILWLFKHFGFIGTNTNVYRPIPIPQARRYRYVKKHFQKAYLEEIRSEPSLTEEEEIIKYETVVTPKDGIKKMNAEYEKLEKIPLGNNE